MDRTRNEKAFESSVLDAFLCEVADFGKPEQMPTRHRLVRRAAEFLHAHCHEPLSIAEICAAVGANRRTLHLGFQELFGVSPIAYLTALRLNRARSDLQKSDSGDLTITQVAMNWVFFTWGDSPESFGLTSEFRLPHYCDHATRGYHRVAGRSLNFRHRRDESNR